MSINTKNDAQNALRDCNEKAFFTQNLERVPDLQALSDLLFRIRDDVYAYHTSEHHNHFSDWIAQVLGDDELASTIFNKSKEEAAEIVKSRLEWLKNKAL